VLRGAFGLKFFAISNSGLVRMPFVAVISIRRPKYGAVTVDFAAKALDYSVPPQQGTLQSAGTTVVSSARRDGVSWHLVFVGEPT